LHLPSRETNNNQENNSDDGGHRNEKGRKLGFVSTLPSWIKDCMQDNPKLDPRFLPDADGRSKIKCEAGKYAKHDMH
jgi:hypothetical protein